MNKIKNFFITIWYYITYTYYLMTTRKIDKKLKQIVEEDRRASITEKDIEFLTSIGVRVEKSKNQD